jgi:hypothetical protein
LSDRTPSKRDETLQTAIASRGRRNWSFAGKSVHNASNVGLLAMQKVVGSSPISRLESPANRGVSRFWIATQVLPRRKKALSSSAIASPRASRV